MKKYKYIGRVKKNKIQNLYENFSKFILILFLFFISPNIDVKAQDVFIGEKEIPAFIYDEIPVYVLIEGYGTFYLDVIYTNNDLLYINIADLFRTLKIPCFIGQQGDSIGGFIENEKHPYSIDYNTKQIKVGERTIITKNGLVKEMNSIYMVSSLFAEGFGISLIFNYRALSLILRSNFELPLIKEQRLEKLRSNVLKLKGEEIVDTIVKRDYHLFRFGNLDWGLSSNQIWKQSIDNVFSLGLGTELLYGEANIFANYSSRNKFDTRQIQYLWRWVDNDKKIIKQAQVGKISNQSIAFINAPIIGFTLRNSPTTVRKASGFYTINDYTEPNWTVELYINDILVDYTKTDASGLYIFKVPIVYGYTILKLKFFGPLGEERIEERTMNIPYTLMPAKEFEYGLTGGVLQDNDLSRFGKVDLKYGLTRFLTLGGGLEYLSSIPNKDFIPYTNLTIQPFSKLIISGEYAHGVKTRGLLNFNITKSSSLEIEYTNYVKGQNATIFNGQEEIKAKLSLPYSIKRLNGFLKIDYTQLYYSGFRFNQTNIVLSTYYEKFNTSSSAQINWINKNIAYINADLALAYRLKYGFVLKTLAMYNISENKFRTCKVSIEKNIKKGYISVSYERNFVFKDNYIYLNFKFDLPFARANITASHNNGNITTSEGASGSFAFGGGKQFVYVSNNSQVSKGGIILFPFLDLNKNGVFDKGESKVLLLNLRVNGGKAIYNEKDSTIKIPNLNGFTYSTIELNNNDLDNIAWRFNKKTYSILIDPNQFKRIDIPVISMGEVSGMVYKEENNFLKGIGRILVKFYKKDSNKAIAETLTESDGYMYYMGLEPGEYIARVDSSQLSNLEFSVDNSKIEFLIKALEDGDIVNDINFVLSDRKAENTLLSDSIIIKNKKDSIDSDSLINKYIKLPISKTNIKGSLDTSSGLYYIQIGAFGNINNAINYAKKVSGIIQTPYGIIVENNLYKIRLGYFKTRDEANKKQKPLIKQGVKSFVFSKKQ